MQSRLVSAIESPGFILSFSDLSGNVYGIDTLLNGTLNRQDRWVEFSFRGPDFDSKYLVDMFPQMHVLGLDNLMRASVSVYGMVNQPIIKADLISKLISRLFSFSILSEK